MLGSDETFFCARRRCLRTGVCVEGCASAVHSAARAFKRFLFLRRPGRELFVAWKIRQSVAGAGPSDFRHRSVLRLSALVPGGASWVDVSFWSIRDLGDGVALVFVWDHATAVAGDLSA